MKKVFVFLFALVFCSCNNFAGTDQSVFSEGLWIIPTIIFLAAAFFGTKAYQAYNSGSVKYDPVTKTYSESSDKVPFLKIGYTKWAIALLVIGILVMIGINGSR